MPSLMRYFKKLGSFALFAIVTAVSIFLWMPTKVQASYLLNPFTKKLDYYQASGSGGGSGNGTIGTSTINYFTVYSGATSTTGTPMVQIVNGSVTFSSTTFFNFTSSTSATTTNLFVSGLTNIGGLTFTNATGTNISISGIGNFANVTSTNVSSTNNYSNSFTGNWAGNAIPILNGGTNSTTVGSAGCVKVSDGTRLMCTAVGTLGDFLMSNGAGIAVWVVSTSVKISAANITAGTLAIARGGTNSTTIAANGSVIYSDGAAYNATAVGTLGDFLMSTASGRPVWVVSTSVKISAANITSGVLAIAQGGTNSSTIASNGSIVYADGTRYQASAVGSATQVLTSNGAGAPLWINSTSLPYLLITGGTLTGGVTFTTLNGTSVTSTNAFFTNVSSTSATTTNLFVSGPTNLGGGLTFTTATGTSVTSTNLYVSNQGTFGVGTTTWQFFTNGHVNATGTVPVVSSCGTNPANVGNDGAGHITVGSVAASACTLTFTTPYVNTPSCLVTNQNLSVVNAMTYTVATTTIVVSQTALTSAVLDYVCYAHE